MRMYSCAPTSFFKSRWATIMSIPVAFTNCATLISLMYPKCTMNLERQVAGRLAGAALANRVPLDHHELLLKLANMHRHWSMSCSRRIGSPLR